MGARYTQVYLMHRILLQRSMRIAWVRSDSCITLLTAFSLREGILLHFSIPDLFLLNSKCLSFVVSPVMCGFSVSIFLVHHQHHHPLLQLCEFIERAAGHLGKRSESLVVDEILESALCGGSSLCRG